MERKVRRKVSWSWKVHDNMSTCTYHDGCFRKEIREWFGVAHLLVLAIGVTIISQVAFQTSLWSILPVLLFRFLVFRLEKTISDVGWEERRHNSVRASRSLNNFVISALHVA